MIPNLSFSWVRMCASSALRSSALDGMQPTLRQTPPQYCFSITPTLRPSWEARMAATYPPGPAPRTTTSKSLTGASLFPGQSPRNGCADVPGRVQRWSHALPDRRLLRLPRHPAARAAAGLGPRRHPVSYDDRPGPGTRSGGTPTPPRSVREVVENHDVVVNLAGSPTAGNPHSKKWAERADDQPGRDDPRRWPRRSPTSDTDPRSWPATGSASTATTATSG